MMKLIVPKAFVRVPHSRSTWVHENWTEPGSINVDMRVGCMLVYHKKGWQAKLYASWDSGSVFMYDKASYSATARTALKVLKKYLSDRATQLIGSIGTSLNG